jgi:HPt (histidine-containing phosphotransfer) domain-containing protein
MRSEAHRLKGLAATCGLVHLAQLAARLEAADPAETSAALEAVAASLDPSIEALREAVASLG